MVRVSGGISLLGGGIWVCLALSGDGGVSGDITPEYCMFFFLHVFLLHINQFDLYLPFFFFLWGGGGGGGVFSLPFL